MCGVFGAFSKQKNQLRPDQENLILSLLRHRGPDGQGKLRLPKAHLLHTRLSVVDPSTGASQPMSSRDGRWHIIFNGECYNYRDLRRTLRAEGSQFRTDSDTEVVLEAFIHYGPEFIKRINGIFSLIIYDSRDERAYIWRDRIGVKPLYWTRIDDDIYFSSEIKPLLVFRDPELNPEALHSFFNLRYVVGTKTMFKDIFEVAPGSFTEIENGEMNSHRYWAIESFLPQEADLQLHRDTLASLIEDSICLESQVDVPLGCFLSGGIDSAVVAAFSRQINSRLTTFTLGTGLADDESAKAKQISDQFGLVNQEVGLTPDLDVYRKAIFALEDPIGDSILLPSWELARSAALQSKVVLSGEGADEIFSGYIHHHVLAAERRILDVLPTWSQSVLPSLFANIPNGIVESVFPYPSRLGRSGIQKITHHLKHLDNDFDRVESLISMFSAERDQTIFAGTLIEDQTRREYWQKLKNLDFEDKLKRLDLRFWASRYTLHRLDRLTMAHSLEARVPYFDHRLVEHMLAVPSASLFSWTDPKKHFRRALPKGLLPEGVVRRKKQAFFIPTNQVFSQTQILEMEHQILDHAHRRSVFDRRQLEIFIRQPNKELTYYKQLQTLFNFELWNQIFLDDLSPVWKPKVTPGI